MNLRQQLAADLGSKIAGCTVGVKFGHGSLEVDNKVFAFTRPDESAALKLPATRIAELIADSEIHHLRMGERTMREWVVIPNIAAPHNLGLLHEAKTYVASLPKTERRKTATKAAKKATKKQ
ncbi:hypothetical protein GCM10011507_17790 [Edaphobacter acidisoli]|uniref:TfoX N-terminal domain-containing protein n=1 Tax=Edaphobacter acidisoli TaxID=2040573 RepID=A0A916W4Y5_9BACT|nr:hypothetical protein [Edaphobacter acidisoli]GGA66713.1 hypothetical protein GCM10011507_17790 [Edaphobacter acidisoli]